MGKPPPCPGPALLYGCPGPVVPAALWPCHSNNSRTDHRAYLDCAQLRRVRGRRLVDQMGARSFVQPNARCTSWQEPRTSSTRGNCVSQQSGKGAGRELAFRHLQDGCGHVLEGRVEPLRPVVLALSEGVRSLRLDRESVGPTFAPHLPSAPHPHALHAQAVAAVLPYSQVERLHVEDLQLEELGASALVQLVETHPALCELTLKSAFASPVPRRRVRRAAGWGR
eukprot:scaffold138_cov396-Prasinococcus_capsulatus_cf.AAC.3